MWMSITGVVSDLQNLINFFKIEHSNYLVKSRTVSNQGLHSHHKICLSNLLEPRSFLIYKTVIYLYSQNIQDLHILKHPT